MKKVLICQCRLFVTMTVIKASVTLYKVITNKNHREVCPTVNLDWDQNLNLPAWRADSSPSNTRENNVSYYLDHIVF